MNNWYLTGMMGSGKSVTAAALAGLAGRGVTDLDREIAQNEKRSINAIFAESGEAYFRDLESRWLERMAARSDLVVATGGGVILREANVHLMKKTGIVIYLETSLETLWQRVRLAKDRPLLKKPNPKAELEKILLSRKKLYESACSLKILTDGRSGAEVARELYGMLGGKK
ncbi:MAG: shikimate kinase [Candidatus Omnitrophota bacterium]